MTRSLAPELPRGIAAVSLDPGIVYTNMAEISNPKNISLSTSIEVWKQKAVPFLLKLTPDNNGRILTIPI
jgi:NAD(P)-dependent dehydrogenase (short-subunit alcohol dehydrogenase family)